MAKLSADLEREVIERVQANETLVSIRQWLKDAHGIDISCQALSQRVEKFRGPSEPVEPAKKPSKKALSFDAHRMRLSRLLKQVTDDAMAERSPANIDKVNKITTAWARLEESHREYNRPVDESVSDLAALLAKA